MEGMTAFVLYAVLALFTFFAGAPILLSSVSTFTIQSRLADAMIAEGIITEADKKMLQPKKQIAGVVITVIVCAVIVALSYKFAPMGFLCRGAAFVAGCFKFRKVLQFNSLTVERFKNTYNHVMDEKKYNAYVKKMF